MEPQRNRIGLRARLRTELGTGLTEMLTLLSLAITGFVLRITFDAMPLGFFGEHEAAIETASFFAPWLLMGGYGVARGVQLVIQRWIAPRFQGDDAPTSARRRRRVASAERHPAGFDEHVLTREEFFAELERVLRPSRTGLSPTGLMLVRLEDVHGEELLQPEIADTMLASARTGDWVGHLGGGLFGLILPRTTAGKGQRVRQRMCAELCSLADAQDASVRESFVTSSGHEEVRTLYERATAGLRVVELSEAGALRRVG